MADLEQQLSAAQEHERDELARATRAVLSTPEGRRYVFHLLELAAIYAEPFSGDDAATNYNLGRQSVGRRMIAEFDALDPRLYPTLLIQVADQRAVDQAIANSGEASTED